MLEKGILIIFIIKKCVMGTLAKRSFTEDDS